MIFDTANLNCCHFVFSRDTSQVGPQSFL